MLLKKHFLLLSMLKTIVLLAIFVGTYFIFWNLWLIESLKEHNLFEFFCNIINVTFLQFNASLLNKIINFIF